MSKKIRLLCLGFLLFLIPIASADNALALSVTYTYDSLGRVTTALYDNGTCVVYAYDANGNRTAQTNTNGGSPIMPTWGTGTWGCFSWTP